MRQGGRGHRRQRGHQVPRRRHTLLPTMKLRLAASREPDRSRPDRGAARHRRSGDTSTIGAMMKHAEVAIPRGEGGDSALARWPHSSAIACAQPAPSAVSVANNDPSADYRPRVWRSNATISPTSAKIAAETSLGHFHAPPLGRRRDHHQVSFTSIAGGLHQVPQRLALCPTSACSWPNMRDGAPWL
jgi:carbon-monoxide dehydrogenase medium subunit